MCPGCTSPIRISPHSPLSATCATTWLPGYDPVPAVSENLEDLVGQLGGELPDDLVLRAVTHRSYAYENGGLPTNERLEFLGDSVLGLVVTEELYRRHPDLPEGQLAKLRAAVVNSRALAEVARTLDIGRFLRLRRGEEASGGGRTSPTPPRARGGPPRRARYPPRRGGAPARRRLHRPRPRADPGRHPRSVRAAARRRSPARGRPRLEDVAAGAWRQPVPRRAGVRRERKRPRPRQGLPCHGDRGRGGGGRGGRPQQERGRTASRRAGMDGALPARPRQHSRHWGSRRRHSRRWHSRHRYWRTAARRHLSDRDARAS